MKTTGRDMAVFMALALAYRALFLWVSPRVLDTADAIHYVETARALAQGAWFGYDPKIPVLYPLLGAAVSGIVPDMEWACRWVSFTASILLIIPVYLVARAMHGRRAAQIGALGVAIWPWLADYGCSVSTEAAACLWWFLGVWLLFKSVRIGKYWMILAPWPFFALHLTRPEGLAILLSAPVVGFLMGGWEHRRQSARRLSSFVFVSVVLLILNTVYIRQFTGQTTANYRIGFIVQEFDIARFADTAAKTVTDVLPIMLGPVMLLFLGVGLFYPRPIRRDLLFEAGVGLFALAQWFVSLFVLSPAPRYLMAPIIALSLWSASGMALISQTEAQGWWRRARWLPVGALVAVMAGHTGITLGSEYVGRPPREPREYKIAGCWMRDNLAPGLIFCRKPQVGFYAGMPSTGPALTDTMDEALRRAREAKVRYVVVDERYTAQDVPGMRPLLEPGQAPSELRLLNQFNLYPRCRVLIYELSAGTDPGNEGS